MTIRSFVVPRNQSGRSLASLLKDHFSWKWSRACQLIRTNQVRIGKQICSDPHRRVPGGQRISVEELLTPISKTHGPGPLIRFADGDVVVVDKPAGLTTMRHPDEVAEFGDRARRFLPATLADLLPPLLAPRYKGKTPHLRPVHRLDKETSGLVVFAASEQAGSHLGKQFRDHTVERRYLALVRGKAEARKIQSDLVLDRGDGRRGSTTIKGKGKHAVTNVRIIEELGLFTLVECRLETGRTHQVRIHLGESGIPLCGERIYDRPLHGFPLQKDTSGAKRPALHASYLGFQHPKTGQIMSWESPLPADMFGWLKKLRIAKHEGL